MPATSTDTIVPQRISRAFTRYRPMLESLEARLLLIGPSGREQEMLEMLNRMRMNPADELSLLIDPGTADVNSAMNFFKTNRTVLREQWKSLQPAPPLAWNEDLTEAALFHNEQMILKDTQAHQVEGEPDLRARATNAGYTTQSGLSENVYAFMKNLNHGHAAFAIDWGPGTDGIQNPAGHRNNMMNPVFREIGLSIADDTQNRPSVGPLLVTQDFGAPVNFGNSFLLGVVFNDLNGDGICNVGEGIGEAQVKISGTGGTFNLTSMTAGGYQQKVPAGTYTVTVTSDSLGGAAVVEDVVVGSKNVKQDITPDLVSDLTPPIATLLSAPNVTVPAEEYQFIVQYSDNEELDINSIGLDEIRVVGPDNFSAVATMVSRTDGPATDPVSVTYAIDVPGGSWDSDENGQYTLQLLANKVRDIEGNVATAKDLGSFNVNVSAGPSNSPPAATFDDKTIKTGGNKWVSFTVRFSDDQAIDLSTIDGDDVRVLGPDGFDQMARFVKLDKSTNNSPRHATYRIEAPGGYWDSEDDGEYTVQMRANQVGDGAGGFASGGNLGTLQVDISSKTLPTATLRAKTLRVGGKKFRQFKIELTDNGAIDTAKLDGNDVRVAGPGDYDRLAQFVKVDSVSNGSPRIATYRIRGPGGKWNAADNGKYKVYVRESQVADTKPNYVPAGKIGRINVAIDPPASKSRLTSAFSRSAAPIAAHVDDRSLWEQLNDEPDPF